MSVRAGTLIGYSFVWAAIRFGSGKLCFIFKEVGRYSIKISEF
jgi:hypothetical protein